MKELVDPVRPAPVTDPIKGELDGQGLPAERFSVTMDGTSYELLKRLQRHTGLSPAQTLMKVFPAHLHELWSYLEWLDGLPQGELRRRGMYLLHSYGPDDLITSIKALDPTYVTREEELKARMVGQDTLNPTARGQE